MQKRTKTQRNINGNSKTHQKEQKEQKYYLLYIILFSTKRIILHQKDYFIPKKNYFIKYFTYEKIIFYFMDDEKHHVCKTDLFNACVVDDEINHHLRKIKIKYKI